MRPSSTAVRRLLAAAACLLALTAVAGCKGNAPVPTVYFTPAPVSPSSSCPPGQHLATVPAALPECGR